MGCYHKTKFDVPLFTEEVYLSLGEKKTPQGQKSINELRKKLKFKEKISRRPVAKRLIPRCIRSEMKVTIGVAEPEECGMFDGIEYPQPSNVIDHLIDKPTIWDEGRKSLELVMGTQKSLNLTIDEFCARKRTTASLIKLLKNAVVRMQILLAIDHHQVTKDEKSYFSRRLQESMKKCQQEIMNSIPDQKELVLRKVQEQRSAFMKGINNELKEEILLVRKLKEDFMSRCFEFQCRWIMQDVTDKYLHIINKYSEEWREKLKQLEIQTEERVQKYKEQSKTISLDYLNKLSDEAGRKWEEMIRESKRDFLEKIKEIARDAIFFDAQIEAEKERKKNILDAMEKSSAIIQSVLVQFEKFVTFGFKGKPGESNYFLSFQKLKELNDFLCNKLWQERLTIMEREKALSQGKETVDMKISESQKSLLELTRENPSMELQQFKDCIDSAKISTFREDVLGLRKIADEVRCYAINLAEERHVEVSPVYVNLYRADSAYIADKLQDAYRLAESAHRKRRHRGGERREKAHQIGGKKKSTLFADSYMEIS